MTHKQIPALTFSDIENKIFSLGGKLSGSRAFGDPHPGSDWDYHLPLGKLRQFERWLTDNNITWDSGIAGAIDLEIEGKCIEVSILFPRKESEYERRDKIYG